MSRPETKSRCSGNTSMWLKLREWASPHCMTNVMSIDRKSVQANVRLCGQHDYSNSLE